MCYHACFPFPVGISNSLFDFERIFSEGFRLGPIKEQLPAIGFGKIKLALAQLEKSTGQVIQEVIKLCMNALSTI